MWAIRILNGPQAGKVYKLKKGKNKIGRASSADFQVQSTSVSKEHFEIEVLPDRLIITDLQSANGTYLNGVRVKKADAKIGDKFSASDVIFDIVFAQDRPVGPTANPGANSLSSVIPPSAIQAAGQSHSHLMNAQPNQGFGYPPQYAQPSNQGPQIQPNYTSRGAIGFKEKFESYMEDVALPGVYRLPEVFEFKNVIYGFAVAFIIVVTLLSMIPINFITSESITATAKRRALTVARTLANANSKVIKEGRFSDYNSELIFREDGIDDVFVVGKDGTILAPADRAGTTPKGEVEFIYKLRGQNKEMSVELANSRIAAGAPIAVFDPQLGENVARAYAVVVFNSEALAFDDGKAVTMFIQMLFLSALVGVFVFYLLIKLIERPFALLRQELDLALKEGRDQAEVNFKLPVVQDIMVSVNSLISRALHGDSAKPLGSSTNKEIELSNVLGMFGYPALLINRDSIILSANIAFERLTGVGANRILGQSIQFIPDQALQKNLQDLMNNAKTQPNQIAKDQLDIGGNQAILQCQAVSGLTSEPEYYIVTFSPADEIQGGAA